MLSLKRNNKGYVKKEKIYPEFGLDYLQIDVSVEKKP